MSASRVVLQRLEQRAAEADHLILQLRTQLNTLKKAAAVSACRVEENQLTVENNKLRQEVLNMKAKLSQAETQNGVVQVALPKAGQRVAAPAVVKSEPPATSAPPGVSTTNVSAETQKNQQKKKKEKQEKKGEGKKTQQPAPEAAPVDVSRLDMRIGHIADIKKHPDADGLYVEQVDLGEGRFRTIVSGLVQHVPMEKMHGRLAIFLINLKPAKMRGILSEGMIMCASSPQLVEIIDPPEGAVIGDRISVEGYAGTPDALLNPKKKIWEQIQPELQVNGDGVATYKGAAWQIEGKGLCKSPTARSQGIK